MYGLISICRSNGYVSWGNGRDFITAANKDYKNGKQHWLNQGHWPGWSHHDPPPPARKRPPACRSLSSGPRCGSHAKLLQSGRQWRSLGRHDKFEEMHVATSASRPKRQRPSTALAASASAPLLGHANTIIEDSSRLRPTSAFPIVAKKQMAAEILRPASAVLKTSAQNQQQPMPWASWHKDNESRIAETESALTACSTMASVAASGASAALERARRPQS